MEGNKTSQKIILVVDDKESERLLLEIHLREWGFIPLSVRNGIEALEVLRTNHVEIVLETHRIELSFIKGLIEKLIPPRGVL